MSANSYIIGSLRSNLEDCALCGSHHHEVVKPAIYPSDQQASGCLSFVRFVSVYKKLGIVWMAPERCWSRLLPSTGACNFESCSGWVVPKATRQAAFVTHFWALTKDGSTILFGLLFKTLRPACHHLAAHRRASTT